jgi:aldose 1-epimerase
MSREFFGVAADGRRVDQFELRNGNGVTVRCVPYGCRITSILLPAASGHRDIVLGFDSLDQYEADGAGHGAFIGRYANRIEGASVRIGGRDYRLLKNDGGNFLHGSLNKRLFTAESEARNSVTFKTVSRDGEDGFPGNLSITVRYALDDGNRLTMEYFAATDADTHVNLTNHAYFNLAAGMDETIENHLLRVESGAFLETTEKLIPTGRVIPVNGTPFDFRGWKTIGRDINSGDINLKYGRGYDHCFLIERKGPAGLSLAAEARSPDGELTMKVFTTQPAVQFYTGNFLDGTAHGKGRQISRRAGFCLETQHYPDAPHHPGFPSTLLKPEEEFHETTVLEFVF